MSRPCSLKKWIGGGVALLALAVAGSALGQATNAGLGGADFQDQGVVFRNGAASLESAISLPTGFEIAEEEGSTILAYKKTIKLSGLPSSPGTSHFLSFTARTPIDRSSADAFLQSLNSLGEATSGELKYTGSKLINSNAPALGGDPSSPVAAAADAEARRICRIVEAAYRAQGSPAEDAGVIDCVKFSLPGFAVKRYAPREFDNYMSLFFDPDASLIMWGVSAAVGTEKFDYRNPATFAELSSKEKPWSLSAYWAYEKISWQSLLTFRFEHKRLYEEAAKEIRCRNPSDVTTCLEARFGPPQGASLDLVSMDFRRRLGGYGFALTASYDVREDSVAVDVPVYFIRDGSGGFNGGVRAGWDSKRDDVKIGVFVNTAFDLFGG